MFNLIFVHVKNILFSTIPLCLIYAQTNCMFGFLFDFIFFVYFAEKNQKDERSGKKMRRLGQNIATQTMSKSNQPNKLNSTQPLPSQNKIK